MPAARFRSREAVAEDEKKMYLGHGAAIRGKPSFQDHEFDCPVCHWYTYDKVKVPGRDGQLRETTLYRCGLCTATFTDPQQFSSDRAGRKLNLGKK